MATQSLEVIRRVVMEAQSKGFDKLAADLDKVAKSQEGVAGSSTTVTKSQGSVDQAFARTERTLDKTMVAYQAFARQVKATNDALEQGRASPERAVQLIGLADAQLQKATGSTAQFAQSTGLARHELINLGRQLQDVVVSLGSGQGFGTVILQQGAQIGDVFTSMRGTVGAALTQLAGMAVRVAPVAIALGAVATAIYAVNKAMNEQREARIATTSGLGRLSDVSAGQVQGLAERGRTPGMSSGEAREGVLEFTKAGADATVVVEGLALATRVAATRGIELGEAYKFIAGIMRDPAQALKQIDAEYNVVTEDQKKNTATMQANGDVAGATKVAFDALRKALVGSADAATSAQRKWAEFRTDLEEIIGLYGRLFKFQTDWQQELLRRPPAPVTEAGERLRSNLGPATALPGETPRFGEARVKTGSTAEQVAAAKQIKATEDEMVAMEKAINGELDKQKKIRDDIKDRISDANQAQADQLRLAQAFTTEQKAAATEIQKRNELLRAAGGEKAAPLGSPKRDEIEATSKLAGAGVKGAAAAEAQQALAVQQAQLGMYQQLAAAAQMQGMAGVILNAQLQMELQLRQQGLNVMLPENQARIQNAGILAQQAAALRDLAQAQQMRASGADQVEMMRLENSLIGEDAAVRAKLTTIMQGEIEARALERQGMTESAAAAREVAAAKGEEAARSEDIKRVLGEETAARQRNADAARAQAQAAQQRAQAEASYQQRSQEILRSQGRDPYSMPLHQEGGTTRASDWPQAGAGGQGMTFAMRDVLAEQQGIARFGEGNFSMVMVNPKTGAMLAQGDPKKIADMTRAAQDQLRSNAQQAQQSRLSLVMSTLAKHIQNLNETVSTSTQKAQELQQKVEANEQKRQQRIQQYLDAGPSPFEQNADVYYDPKKRLLFAEQIAGNTDQLLKQQADAAKAEADAAQAQIKGLEDQQQALQDQSELLSAGVDLTKQELTALEALIGVVRDELPANLATAYDRMQMAGAAGAQKSAEDVMGGLPLAVKGAVTRSGYGYPGATYGGVSGLGYGSGATSFYSGGLGTTGSGGGAKLGGFASGGAFTVPGSGGTDRPFRIGLTPGERVTITPPGKRAGGGTTVERMIIQLPPGAEPIQLMNKTSRNSLTRATRRMGRMA